MKTISAKVKYGGKEWPANEEKGWPANVNAVFTLEDGSEAKVNAGVNTDKARGLLSLLSGQVVSLAELRGPKGSYYDVVFDTVTGLASAPPGPQKEGRAQAALNKYELILDMTLTLVTSKAIEYDLTMTDANIFENARAIATHLNIDL